MWTRKTLSEPASRLNESAKGLTTANPNLLIESISHQSHCKDSGTSFGSQDQIMKTGANHISVAT